MERGLQAACAGRPRDLAKRGGPPAAFGPSASSTRAADQVGHVEPIEFPTRVDMDEVFELSLVASLARRQPGHVLSGHECRVSARLAPQTAAALSCLAFDRAGAGDGLTEYRASPRPYS